MKKILGVVAVVYIILCVAGAFYSIVHLNETCEVEMHYNSDLK